MKHLVLSVLLGMGCFLSSHAEVVKSRYAITSPDYEGAVSDGFDRKDKYLIKKINYLHAENISDKKETFKECHRHCFAEEKCVTFVVNNKTRACFLTKYNRCEEPRVFLRRYSEYTTYEMKERINSPLTMETCFQKCLLDPSTPCVECARIYCHGIQCDQCNKTCWEIPPIQNITYFWVNLQSPEENIYCDKEWQLIFTKGNLRTYHYLFDNEEVVLKLVVRYNSGGVKEAYFKSIKETDKRIDVGEYLGGDAGNWWAAPFQDKALIYFQNSTCYNFYYEKKSDCDIPQISTWKDQRESGIKEEKVQRGFVWLICDKPPPDNDWVENIQFFITPLDQSQIDQIENDYQKITC